MVMTDARPIQANYGSRDSVGDHGERLQRAIAPCSGNIDNGVRVVGDDQESYCDW
jgi:hypothetical protein